MSTQSPLPSVHPSTSPFVAAVVGALTLMLAAALTVSGGLPGRSPEPAAAADKPSRISAVSTRPGPEAGTLTIRWASDGKRTDYYRIETGLTMFSKTDTSMARSGRHAHVFTVSGERTSITLTRKQLRQAGAPLRSAQHLYFRVFAVNKTARGTVVRQFPYLRAAQPTALSAQGSVPIRVASFNVRTVSKTDTGVRSWRSRAPYVARTILSRNPGLVALQELSPGAITGRHGDTRQTQSLVNALHARGGSRYALVRTTSYVAGGVVTGSQGARIAYDTSRYRLLSRCHDTSVVNGKRKPFSASCSFTLPILGQGSERDRRHVAYAQFEDRATGTRFWFVSAHLYPRQSAVPFVRQVQETLRSAQAKKIITTMDGLNRSGLPIVFGGDINSWQNTPAGYAPHQRFVEADYYDTAAAVRRVGLHYATMNKFATRMAPTGVGFGARLDTIMVKGSPGASRFENVMRKVDRHRASDHNMIVADFRLAAS